jgi:Leucine-rich repeat (LRR) protein
MQISTTLSLVLFSTVFGAICTPTSSASSSSPSSASSSTSYQAPDECQWLAFGADDATMICKLRTINSELEKTNFSVIQTKNLKRLKLECSEGLLFESNLNVGSFQPLLELQSLWIEYCKVRNLVDGALEGLKGLKNFTMRTHNNDWSTMSLQIAPNVFNKDMASLQRLDLGHNNMWTLPDEMLCPLKNLEYLNLTNNRLRDMTQLQLGLSKSCGRSLEVLDISANSIDNLPAGSFAGLIKLKELYVQKNKLKFITDYALEGLSALSVFDASDNQLNSLKPNLFFSTKAITEIHLHNNSISILPPSLFTTLSHLKLLDLSKNFLTSNSINSVTFKGLNRLAYLDLSFNKINKLERESFRDLQNLKVLRLNDNLIESIGEHRFTELGSLNFLVLSNNRISSIERFAFQGLKSLTTLSLDYNQLSFIHSLSLMSCYQLEDFHLNGNKLTGVPEVLYYVPLLKTLDLGENLLTSIDSGSFRNMSQIYGLRLTDNRITSITRGTFSNMKAVQIMNLSQNKISNIDAGTFDENRHLQAIRLDGNLLSNMSGLFQNLPQLLWLNMSDNHLPVLDYAQIPSALQWLDVHANKITEFQTVDVIAQLNLATLDASLNELTEISGSRLPNSIETLSLNDNQIAKVQSYTFFKKPNLSTVDLRRNKITTLDVNTLRISAVPEEQALPEFKIAGNPFQCDCELDWLRTNDRNSRTQPKLVDLTSIQCTLLFNRVSPQIRLVEASSKQLLCKYESHCTPLCQCCDYAACDCSMECPDKCTCYHDLSWSSNVVECSRSGYDKKLPDLMPMDSTQIYLDGNHFPVLDSHSFLGRKRLRTLYLNHSGIEIMQNRTFYGLKELQVLQLNHNRISALNGYEFHGLENLRELYLQSNQISSIRNRTFNFFRVLQVLRLDDNLLVNYNLWSLPNHLSDMRLASNPWSCDCEFVEMFREYLKTYAFVKDHAAIRCTFPADISDMDGFAIQSSNQTPMCSGAYAINNNIDQNITAMKTVLSSQHNDYYLPSLISVASALVIVVIIGVLVFTLQYRMRVWLHSRFGVRLFRQSKELEKMERDKLFDVFVSYSSKDGVFVVDQLAPSLETDNPPFKVCLHYRDIPVGAYISDAIVQAIDSSRRTIMVLSPNFIKFEWSRFEFRSAHHQMLRDRRHRPIVILLGEVPQKDLDPDIRLYLKTSTCLKWGDKLFWKKLRYALPDILPPKARQQHNNQNQAPSSHHPVSTSNQSSFRSYQQHNLNGWSQTRHHYEVPHHVGIDI